MKTYTTVSGDMWDLISKKVYGDEKFTDVLINANPEHRMLYTFPARIALDIPEIEERISADDLPPWKRADG